MAVVHQQLIEKLVSSHQAIRHPATLAKKLNDYISENYPWRGTHIDWPKISGSIHFDWGQASDNEAHNFLKETTIGTSTKVFSLYGNNLPILEFEAEFAFSHLSLISCASEMFFLFAGEAGSPKQAVFAEFETGSHIWGWRQA